MNYKDYVQTIRQFQKDSVMLAVTEVLWNINSYSNQNGERTIIQSQAPRVFCIAAAAGNNHRSKKATSSDIKSLCHQHGNIKDSINDSGYLKEEANELKNAWYENETLKKEKIQDG